MSEPGTITDLLVAVGDRLVAPRRARWRVLAELEDHLLDAVADLHAAGLEPEAAEREAVRRFGSPRQLAEELARELAAAGAQRSTVWSSLSALALAILLSLVGGGPAGQRAPWASVGFPSGLVELVLGQVAFVAAGLTVARAVRSRSEATVPCQRLRLIARGNLVVLVAAGAGAAPIAGIALAHPAALVASAPAFAPVAALGALLGLLAPAAVATWGAARATAALPPAAATTDTPLDDLAACTRLAHARLAARAPGPARAIERAGRRAGAALRARAARPLRGLDLRAHPWRFALAVAALAGLLLAAGHGVTDRADRPTLGELPAALLAGALLACIEAACALAGFAVLGRYLGLRPLRRAPE